ncbi:MAG: DNA replication/repair protein RecF [Myxococcales bacterium]
MVLREVTTRDFRNLAHDRVPLGPSTTVLFGPNGQGKTNFLEACYLVCTLRPLRAQKLAELVRFGGAEALVRASFAIDAGEREIEVTIRDGARAARLDGKPVRDPDDLFGGIAVVAFTPDDLWLVKGSPDGRRRLLDRAVQNQMPAHLADARDYLRALKARNQLLRTGATDDLRDAFDVPLARLGARIRLRRERLLDSLRGRAARAFAEVTREDAALSLAYQASGRDSDGLGPEAALRGESELEARLLAAFARRLPRDRERGYTSVGPHADDLAVSLGDEPARTFASQGQARAAILAFKIAEIESLRSAQGRTPLLLLDDVSSELDPERNAFLMAYLGSLGGQVVLTTTDPRLVSRAATQAVFHQVSKGRIAHVSAP